MSLSWLVSLLVAIRRGVQIYLMLDLRNMTNKFGFSAIITDIEIFLSLYYFCFL
ncbi:hypothetical protein T03_8907 [Trichinella britovi]|uniref:Uncharacterized protein n=2 Tax=Trichinella TaxID=6333 RepID=A0A0V0Z1F9_TRIBR|nr:hypothetical protein T05_1626 [Trichinella murrelli]KRY05850.1 hypothetical protein T03_8907 [Trichinella britovi]KRZ73852.1 hypothetical protein T08_8632 [Trichinella sp. T8]